MRTSAILILFALTLCGCDFFSHAGKSYLNDVEGVWTLTQTIQRIERDGTISQTQESGPYIYEIAKSVRCFAMTLEAAGDHSRVTALRHMSGDHIECSQIASDKEGDRIVLILGVLHEHAGMIRERGGSRHVWEFNTNVDGYAIDRQTWVLTR